MLTQMSLKVKYPNLDTASALTAVENRIPIVSIFVKKTDCNTKINEIEKILSWYIYYYSRILRSLRKKFLI